MELKIIQEKILSFIQTNDLFNAELLYNSTRSNLPNTTRQLFDTWFNAVKNNTGQSEEIKHEIKKRNITELLHFTRFDNLPSILRNGIVPREQFNKLRIYSKINDSERFDNKLDSTSVSVPFPNYKYFFKLLSSGKNTTWVILSIDPSILWDGKHLCQFYSKNAASGILPCKFNELFDKNNNSKYTINPQAEIMIKGKIDRKYIKHIYFKTYADKEKYYGSIDAIVDAKMFGPRSDYHLHTKEKP